MHRILCISDEYLLLFCACAVPCFAISAILGTLPPASLDFCKICKPLPSSSSPSPNNNADAGRNGGKKGSTVQPRSRYIGQTQADRIFSIITASSYPSFEFTYQSILLAHTYKFKGVQKLPTRRERCRQSTYSKKKTNPMRTNVFESTLC